MKHRARFGQDHPRSREHDSIGLAKRCDSFTEAGMRLEFHVLGDGASVGKFLDAVYRDHPHYQKDERASGKHKYCPMLSH